MFLVKENKIQNTEEENQQIYAFKHTKLMYISASVLRTKNNNNDDDNRETKAYEILPLGMGTYLPTDPEKYYVAAKRNWKQNSILFHVHICCLHTPKEISNPYSP